MRQENERFKVAQKGFTSKNYFEISCNIEIDRSGPYPIASDLIFFEISPGYKRNKALRMKLGTIDLRNISLAIKECLQKGETKYRKYTDPTLAGGSGKKNEISIAIDDKTLYVNIKSGDEKIGFGFDFWSATSAANMITLMAEETERALYRYQRITEGNSY